MSDPAMAIEAIDELLEKAMRHRDFLDEALSTLREHERQGLLDEAQGLRRIAEDCVSASKARDRIKLASRLRAIADRLDDASKAEVHS